MQKDLVLLGFDVGGTKLGIGLGTSSGRILDGWRMANVDTRPGEVLPRIASEARRMVEKQGLRMEDVAAFGEGGFCSGCKVCTWPMCYFGLGGR